MLEKSVPAWFEIPARDFERAVRFYESVLQATLAPDAMGPMRLAVFPHQKPAPTGAVIQAEGYEPSAAGTVVYLNVSDIRPVLARVEKAGGVVLQPLTQLPDGMGVFAQIRDTEGNRVGVYSAA